jgi:tripeptidyl-peptidase I
MNSMIFLPCLLKACLFLCSLTQATNTSPLTLHESLDRVPSGWYQTTSEPCPSQKIQLHIALRDDGKHELLEQHLLGVSTPGHALYGQHCDHDKLSDLLRPEHEVTIAVLSWIQEAGISTDDVSIHHDWINIETTLDRAGRLLDAKYHSFENIDSTVAPLIRTLSYSVPKNLRPHIQMIQPTTHFSRLKPQQVSSPSGPPAQLYGSPTKLNASFCINTTTPDCLRALYNIGNFKANASSGAKLGISGFNYQIANTTDLQLFLNKYAPAENKSKLSIDLTNGANNTQGFASEANLDTQIAVALSVNIPVTYIKTGGVGPLIPDLQQPDGPGDIPVQEPFLAHLSYLLNLSQAELPTVLSVSYAEDEQSHPKEWMVAVCQGFMKLGLRGVSVLVSRYAPTFCIGRLGCG